MKIAFMGSDPIALPMLEYIQSAECPFGSITTVFTQPDRKSGRGMRLQANAIKSWAIEHEIEVLQPKKCGPAEAEQITSRSIDLLLVMAYGQILPTCILESTRNKVLNVHASLLPRLRGASPIHTAVATGSPVTGVSLMEIIPRMDAGPVALQEAVDIEPEASVKDVIASMANAAVELVCKGLGKLQEGQLDFSPQDPAKVSYCRIIEKSDSHLDFNQTAQVLYDRIRAFQPWPGTSFPCSEVEIRILQADVLEGDVQETSPGQVLSYGTGIRIACRENFIVPLVLQRPGGKALPVEAFLRGFPIAPDMVIPSREMRALEKESPFPYRKK